MVDGHGRSHEGPQGQAGGARRPEGSRAHRLAVGRENLYAIGRTSQGLVADKGDEGSVAARAVPRLLVYLTQRRCHKLIVQP